MNRVRRYRSEHFSTHMWKITPRFPMRARCTLYYIEEGPSLRSQAQNSTPVHSPYRASPSSCYLNQPRCHHRCPHLGVQASSLRPGKGGAQEKAVKNFTNNKPPYIHKEINYKTHAIKIPEAGISCQFL